MIILLSQIPAFPSEFPYLPDEEEAIGTKQDLTVPLHPVKSVVMIGLQNARIFCSPKSFISIEAGKAQLVKAVLLHKMKSVKWSFVRAPAGLGEVQEPGVL